MFFNFLRTFQNASQIENDLECELRIKLRNSHKFEIPELMADHLRDLFVINQFLCTTEHTIVERYRDSEIRKITDIDSGNVKYERKQKKSQFENYQLPIDISLGGLVIRIALAREIELSENERKTLSAHEIDGAQTRKRLRHMFSVEKNGVSIASYMLTRVEMPPGTTPFYEFEIEFNLYQGDIRHHIVDTYYTMVRFLSKLQTPFLLNQPLTHFYQNVLSIRDAKPKNMKRRHAWDILNLKNGYTVTNKLDGERMVMMSIPDGPLKGIFAFNKRRTLRFSTSSKSLFVLDTEWFDNRFYVFDCMYDKHNITNLPHSERLEHARQLVSSLSSDIKGVCLSIAMKQFQPARKAIEMLKNMTTYDRDVVNDGLIFTKNDHYQSDGIFKWKFPSKMTIDFSVRWDRNKDGYDLFVYTTGDRLVRLKIGEGKYAFYRGERLRDGGIYEFGYDVDKDQFILFRERADKHLPNFWKIAQDVWEDIINPITEDELQRLMNPIRIISNHMKRDQIQSHCGKKVILDLGVGRGGDLGKYEKVQVSRLFGIEPNENNLKECRERLSENVYMKNRTSLLLAKAQESEKIRSFLKLNNQEDVEVVSSFLSLSFFFFTQNDLDSLVETISTTLKNDGLFIGTTIDGDKTRNLLDQSPNGIFEYDQGYIKWGENKETVIITMKDTIVGENQVESLVDFKKLEEKLIERDIYLVKKEPFVWNKDELTDTENTFNSLYDSFVFQKRVKHDKNKPLFIDEVLRRLSLPENKECSSLFRQRIFNSNISSYMSPLILKFGRKEYHFDGKVMDSLDFNTFKRIYDLNMLNLPNLPKIYGNVPYDDTTKTLFITEWIDVDELPTLREFIDNHPRGYEFDKMIILSLIFQLYHTIRMITTKNIKDISVFVKQDKNITSIRYGDKMVNVFEGYIAIVVVDFTDIDEENTITMDSLLEGRMSLVKEWKEFINLVNVGDDIIETNETKRITYLFDYPVRSKIGIENAGNTCYLNSIIQCVVTPPPIINYFCSDRFRSDLIDYELFRTTGDCKTMFTRAFAKLACQLTTSKKGHSISRRQISDKSHGVQSLLCDIEPRYCEKERGQPMEHDASEFYGSLIDIFRTQLRGTFIQNMYEIEYDIVRVCKMCGTQTITSDTSYDLKLPIPNNKEDKNKVVDLNECIITYSKEDTINKFCQICHKNQDHKSKVRIVRSPNLLTISLSRFYYDKNGVNKLKTNVKFPLELTINTRNDTLRYKLYGSVIHHGDRADSGHYYSYVKTNKDEWTKFNDSSADKIEEKDVLSNTKNVYVLFYHLVE